MSRPLTRAITALVFTVVACRRAEPTPAAGSPSTTAVPSTHNSIATRTSDLSPYRVDPGSLSHAGTITGRVTWQGARPSHPVLEVPTSGDPTHCGSAQPWPALDISADGGIRWAVLALRDVTHGAAPVTTPVTIDQRICRYDPHVAAVAVGTELRFTNSDTGVLHNVHAYYGYDTDDNWFNVASPHGLTITRRAQRAGLARLACDAGHTWMNAYLHTFVHPYFAVTDASGHYQIRNVPPGRYTLGFWHEGWTELRRVQNRPEFGPAIESTATVTIAPDGTTTLNWSLGSNGVTANPQ